MRYVALALLLVGCGTDSAPPAEPTLDPFIAMQDSRVEGPMTGVPEGWRVARGMVEPEKVFGVSFEVPGVVSRVLVQEGDSVRRGQTLARLETAERQAKLAQARELYRSARAAAPHAAEGSGPPPRDLEAAAEERLRQVRESSRFVNGDRAAVQRAVKNGGEEAAADLAIAVVSRRNRGSSAARRLSSKAGDDALARAVSSELRTRVLNLEDAVNKSRIASPLSGLVVSVNTKEGEQWNTRVPQDTFEIVDPRAFVVRVTIPAERARRFAEGEEAWVELPLRVDSADRLLPANVSAVSSADVSMGDEDGFEVLVREVTFKLPSRLPAGLRAGDDVRVGYAP